MHWVGALILLTLVYFVAFGTRRSALLAMVAGVLYLTQGQAIEIGFHFYAVRILALTLLMRVLARRELSLRRLTRIDYAVIVLFAYMLVVFTLRSDTGYITSVADTLDAYFCYFGFRGIIKEEEDLRWLLRKLLILLV